MSEADCASTFYGARSWYTIKNRKEEIVDRSRMSVFSQIIRNRPRTSTFSLRDIVERERGVRSQALFACAWWSGVRCLPGTHKIPDNAIRKLWKLWFVVFCGFCSFFRALLSAEAGWTSILVSVAIGHTRLPQLPGSSVAPTMLRRFLGRVLVPKLFKQYSYALSRLVRSSPARCYLNPRFSQHRAREKLQFD